MASEEDTMLDTTEKSSSHLIVLQESVKNLYHFRDHYFEEHDINQATQKQQDIAKELKLVEEQLDKYKDSFLSENRAQYFLLRGKALNILPSYSESAQEWLSKAVKLDPKLVEAWNELGECYWKKHDIEAAKNCFLGALNHEKNKVSLRNLSMILRQLGKDQTERLKNIEDSVKNAREAVQLDVVDGTSWTILGNAYLTLFFATDQNPKFLKQSITAYLQAEKDVVAKNNPDLHYNRAIVYKYEENYQDALESFSHAYALDPSWAVPQERQEALLKYLDKLQDLVEKKGRLKAKKLHSLLQSLNLSHLGPYGGGSYTSPKGVSIQLQHVHLNNLNEGINLHAVVLGKVTCNVLSEDDVPFTFCIVDKNEDCCSVTVYNLAQGKGVIIGDSVAIPEPFMQNVKVKFRDKEYNFRNIRVDTPVVLVVNGKKLGADKQALTKLAVSILSS